MLLRLCSRLWNNPLFWTLQLSSKSPSNGIRQSQGKQQDLEKGRRQKVPENKQRSLTSSKSNSSLQSLQVNFASTLVPAEDNLINGVDSPASADRLKKTDEVQECCLNCRAREEKIKNDYDRMILFSKKDRVTFIHVHLECVLKYD